MTIKKVSKKTQERCKMLHEVGLKMFLENGYEKTNLSDIVKVTGGSLSTIYQHFGNKEGFFEAVVFYRIEEFFCELEKKLTQEEDQSLENFLYQFGREYIDVFSDKEVIALGRIIYNEGFKDDGKISKMFMPRIKSFLFKVFLNYFNSSKTKSDLKSDDYEVLADEFCTLIREPEYSNAILGYKKNNLTKKQKDEKVKRVVDFFLNGYKK